ncbi:MAG: hypothetical protein ABF649_19260 [Bacillus sp. (in: firmicutes)]
MDLAFWVTTVGGIASFGVWVYYYASLGKIISAEEKEAGSDLTYELNPFTGSSKIIK